MRRPGPALQKPPQLASAATHYVFGAVRTLQLFQKEGAEMLKLAVLFLIMALVSAFYGSGFVPDTGYLTAKIIAPVFLLLFIVFLGLFIRKPAT